MSLPVMAEIAGVNTASLGGCLHSSKTWARLAEGFHDELNSHVFDLERNGLCQVVLCPWVTMRNTSNHTLPDRSPAGLTRTVPSAAHQDGGVKHASGASSKIRGRDNITISTWNKKDTKSCEETPRTNTRNVQLQMEHPWILRNQIEELWQNNDRRRAQCFRQWKRG